MSIHPRVKVGHVHLKVADLNRSLAFYCDVLGFEVMQRIGTTAAFLSAGGYHHHIGLNTWESAEVRPLPRAAQVSTMLLFFIQAGVRWLMRCRESGRRVSISMGQQITE